MSWELLGEDTKFKGEGCPDVGYKNFPQSVSFVFLQFENGKKESVITG